MAIVVQTFLKSIMPIALFGMMGVLSRYCISLIVSRILPSAFPYGTFFINILGSFLIGIVYVAGVERFHLSPALRLGIMIGFLGGFTTFSSFSLDAALLLEKGKVLYALFYFTLSPVLSILFTYFGIFVSRKIW
jgi:CrcB protein